MLFGSANMAMFLNSGCVFRATGICNTFKYYWKYGDKECTAILNNVQYIKSILIDRVIVVSIPATNKLYWTVRNYQQVA